MAPFQGITNLVFRQVYMQHFSGVDKLLTPFFTSIHKQSIKTSGRQELLHLKENGIPVVPQILSKDAEEMVRFANYCEKLGFEEVNWNMGCPYPRVAKKKRGSGLLPYPEIVNEILEQVMSKISIKLSVKTRLGYNNPDEILALIPVINQYPVSEITVHARIGKQLYKGETSLNVFEKVLKTSNIPAGYNGDLFTKNDFARLYQKFPQLPFIMLGRGLLTDPFLPAHLKNEPVPDIEQQSPVIHKFVDDLYYHRRKQTNDGLQTLGNMKEYWWYLSYSFNKPQKVFSLIKKKKTFDDYEDAVNTIFEHYEWLGQKANLFRKEKAEK